MNHAKQIYDELTEEDQTAYQMAILDYQKPKAPSRTHNAPQSVEVAALLSYDPIDPSKDYKRAVIVYPKGRALVTIDYSHASYLPLSYPLFHMHGEQGWNPFIFTTNENSKKKNHITLMQYASFVMQIRDTKEECLKRDIILCGGKLTQQYILDLFICMESERLGYLRRNQLKLKTTLYKGLVNAVAANEQRDEGRFCVLPSTYIGSPRWFHEEYQDAMARVRTFGKPDLFITFTCNPKWPEIVNALRMSQCNNSASHRPDIVSRVFDIKLKALLDDICKKEIFGEVLSILAIVEWQKRNLPHAHVLLVLHPDAKPQEPKDYDKLSCAEIPSKESNRELHELVITHMVHGPCGVLNTNCVCMKDGKCQKRFPKPFNNETTQHPDSYPILCRRPPSKGGVEVNSHKAGKDFCIDNSWIVPYNPYLLLRYQAHINVEICNTVGAVKYLHKYIYKGVSKAIVETSAVVTPPPPPPHEEIIGVNNYNNNNNNDGATTTNTRSSTQHQQQQPGRVIDEIRNFVECRYLGPAEAANRLLSHTLHEAYPPVVRLNIHLPDEHWLRYEEGEEEQALLQQQQQEINQEPCSMLLAYFKAVRHENSNPFSVEQRKYKGAILPQAKELSYQEFPLYFVHESSKGIHKWKRRISRQKQQQKCIKGDVVSRLRYAHPTQGELFYLRMLLIHVKGATSFDSLKTQNGIVHNTFKDVCITLGLVGEDKEWEMCLRDAVDVEVSAFKLRQLFCIILVNNQPQSPCKLWELFQGSLCDDFRYRRTNEYASESTDEDKSEALHSISDLLFRLTNGEKQLKDFGLPEPLFAKQDNMLANKLFIFFDAAIHNPAEHKLSADNNVTLMNETQRDVYEYILKQVENKLKGLPITQVFLDAPGGTGKTFVLNTVISRLIANNISFVSSAFSGIAAILLTAGRTTHSYFKLPVSKSSEVVCNVTNRSSLGKFLKLATVIIIDEAPMLQKEQLEAIHILCHQLEGTVSNAQYRNSHPFANKLIILSGDFRQTLPVCPKESRAGICSTILKRSYLWRFFHTLHLNKNERVLRLCKNASLHEQEACLQFAEFVLRIGDGNNNKRNLYNNNNNNNNSCSSVQEDADRIVIPSEYVFNNYIRKQKRCSSLQDFVMWCYPEILMSSEITSSSSSTAAVVYPPMHERAILCPLNKDVDRINAIAIALFNNKNTAYAEHNNTTFTLQSADSIILNEDDAFNQNEFFLHAYPTEFLNSLAFSGVPPHEIILKPGVTIMLLRNLDVKNGLCNGTKLIFVTMKSNYLMIVSKLKTNNGDNTYHNNDDDERLAIPRIDFNVTETQLPFQMKRRQFPIKLAFAMTINKSQGQSLKRVGIYLPRPLFSHGQLYVAIGRSGLPKETYFYIEDHGNEQGFNEQTNEYYTKNIVWREVLN